MLFSNIFLKKVEYHEKRSDSNKHTRNQKAFSDGYITGAMMIETHRGSKTASDNVRKAYRIINDPNVSVNIKQQAKGMIASMYDYKKEIPNDIDVWGRKIKVKK